MEGSARLVAGAVARMESECALVVAHDGHLVRLDTDKLPHLDDLFERLRKEETLPAETHH